MENSDRARNDIDMDLVFRIQSGERDAFGDLYKRHYRQVEAWVRRHIGDSAFRDCGPDLIQDSFMAVHQALPTFRGEAAFTTWLFRIVSYKCINYRRRNRTRLFCQDNTLIEDLYIEAPDSNPEAILIRRETAEAARKALNALPELYRQPLVLRDIHELSYNEVAEVLKLSLTATKSRIHRGREMLRKIRDDSYI